MPKENVLLGIIFSSEGPAGDPAGVKSSGIEVERRRFLRGQSNRKLLTRQALEQPSASTVVGRFSSLISAAVMAVVMTVAMVLAIGPGVPLRAQTPTDLLSPPASAQRVTVVPDDFLRRWDPLTVFFKQEVGPASGAVDELSQWVSLDPAHPVEGEWVDSRTLVLRPVDPWPALQRFKVEVRDGRRGHRFELSTLTAAPRQTWPETGSQGLEQVKDLTLELEEPLEPTALARSLSLELRPLPGIGEGEARWLDAEDFEVKVLERAKRSDPARYVISLEQTLPQAHRVRVFMQLSLDKVAGRPSGRVEILELTTAEPFRVVSFGCPQSEYPVTQGGTVYAREQALRCENDRRALITFSAEPSSLDLLGARNLVRLSPAVEGFESWVSGRSLFVDGEFEVDTPYRLTLAPIPLKDTGGRALELADGNEVWIYFPSRPPFLRWQTGQGWLERLGPQHLPLEGRGDRRVDVRIHAVDALDRSFWPFSDGALTVNEDLRPPGPGEVPPPYREVWRRQTPKELTQRLRTLGSPTVSTWLDLPLAGGKAAGFGLDLAPVLEQGFGAEKPGSYLVGLRRLDGSKDRSWMRVQVTDLSLTTFEEADRVVFLVTSLADATPVSGAKVRLEGARGGEDVGPWKTFFEGTTDHSGRLVWDVANHSGRGGDVRRVVVAKGQDLLVLDPTRAPDRFHNGAFTPESETWLQWTQGNLTYRSPQPEKLAHVFSERPIYRPEEPVHLQAYARRRALGRLTPIVGRAFWQIQGPGGREWRESAELSPMGSAYLLFDEDDTPSGVYRASLEAEGSTLGTVTFRKEAYRLPRFEVQLSGALDASGESYETARLDEPFEVRLSASYYAGGRVTRQPVRWRVTQFPYSWSPDERPGFVLSSDSRFSPSGRFESTPALDRSDVTDADGGAVLSIDPSVEPTAQPRTYVIEATVTGVDDQTVTATRRVVALPPFHLALKTPRFLEPGEALRPEVLVIGTDNEPLAGQEVTLRLLHRQWHSHLRAGDFSDGIARYVTDVVDEKVFETTLVSGDEPTAMDLPLAEPGVYVVEIESRDRLGRSQSVAVDLYASTGTEDPVTWERPSSPVFQVSSDKSAYQPGDIARLVVRSPFQSARVTAVVEAPEGNRYHQLKVENGQAVFDLEIHGSWSPRLPVHFVLHRGRVPGTAPAPGRAMDLGKPTTLAATRWVDVEPTDLRLKVDVEHPAEAMPGREVEMTVRLTEPDGTPSAGEVTLWLVDRAVLALGKEQRLDPVPSFLTAMTSRLNIHDTRGLVFGAIPWVELPGGGEAAAERGVLDRQTVRKNFQPVPFYQPSIPVGPSGEVVVKVMLPDNLTDFAVRAKAVAGDQRFGWATGRLSVRLPVIVQPALPRFVRPGDQFSAGAVARLISGQGGPGRAQARFEGLEPADPGDLEPSISFLPDRPVKLEFPVRVGQIELDDEGQPLTEEVVVQVGVERSTDQAGDAFEIRLPVVADRRPTIRRWLVDLEPGQELVWPSVDEPVRPGTLSRRLLASKEVGIVRLAAGLDALLEYPFGCTEQRVSKARALIAMGGFREALDLKRVEMNEQAVTELFEWLQQSTTAEGLSSFWPGGDGSVFLTAWVVHFLAEARDAGFEVPDKVSAPLARSLTQALRSDYSGFIDGASWSERIMALGASARWGSLDAAYAAELGRKGDFLVTEDLARLVLAMANAGTASERPELVRQLWDSVIWRLDRGQEVYQGLRGNSIRNPLILPSETRSLATMTQALAKVDSGAQRLPNLVAALVRLGKGSGWGSTQADAAALLALAQVLDPASLEKQGSAASRLTLSVGGEEQELPVGSRPVIRTVGDPQEAVIRHRSGAGAGEVVAVRAETRYVPSADGSQMAAERQGFLVERRQSTYAGGAVDPARRVELTEPSVQALRVGDVVEERIRLVSSTERHFVALVVPLAAGIEVLNPHLATAPPEAQPEGNNTVEPTYTDFRDDHVAFYFDTLPKGSHELFFRARATLVGSFIQPPAQAEMMYDAAVFGRSAGARIEIGRPEEASE